MRIVFLGTPEIASVCLQEILKTKHQVVGVVTQMDKPVGRGNKVVASPVKKVALENNLPVYQFTSIRKEGIEILKNLKPDLLVLVAYGQILNQEILNIALPINLHGSLLPKLRGPSPIQTAILEGLTKTGVTIMKMENGVDMGGILSQSVVDISENDTSQSLFDKVAKVGAKLLVEAIDIIENGKYTFVPQNDNNATYTKMLTKENAKIDFNDTSKNIVNKIRAYNPNPVAFFELDNKKIKVFSARVVLAEPIGDCGEILQANSKQGLVIKTLDGAVEIIELQAPNGKVLTAKQFLNGNKIQTFVVNQ